MRLFLFLAIVFSVSLSSAQSKKLLVLGDSLTEGYGVAKDQAFPAVLEKKIHEGGKKEWTVINAGVSGSTTASGISRMKWAFKNKPDLMILALGANDGLRGLKVEESEKNLGQAIEYAQEQKVPIVLAGLFMPPNYGKEYTEKFKKMYVSLSKKYKVTLIPFVLDKVAGDPKLNLADGIHPNEAGHKIVAETVYQEIKGLL
ncbi:arylesterase [Bdellovibrio sp. HCB337]|uniref:arylesterase n=1 Tax=Bdellovibrio sp. HCB337 TaxID=3394358 RepID=UPI0039A5B756